MDYDVVVIGASSAGLFAAEILAREGKRVVVCEKEAGNAPQARTYIITPGLFRVMPNVDRQLIRNTIDRFSVQAGNEETIIQLSSPDLIIDRAELLAYLRARAEGAGVDFIYDSEFIGFELSNGNTSIIIQTSSGKKLLRSAYLLGADGVNSSVRKESGIEPVPSVPLLQAVIELPEDWDSSLTKVWFDIEDTPYFYWLIPDKDGQAAVGLIADANTNIKSILARFLLENGYTVLEYQAGMAALHDKRSLMDMRVGDLNIILVGDAAGQVKVTTVGGTVTGLVGAQAAAASIIDGVPYQRAHKSGRLELDLHLFIRNLLNNLTFTEYEKLIQAISPAVNKLLYKHDRDSMRAHFWKLALVQPKFIPLGLRLLFRSIL